MNRDDLQLLPVIRQLRARRWWSRSAPRSTSGQELDEQRPPRDRQPWRGFALAVLLSLLATLLRALLRPITGFSEPVLLFIVPVVLSAWFGGFGPGLLATLLCAGLGTFFFVPPVLSVAIAEPADLTRILVFVGEGLLIAVISRWQSLASYRRNHARLQAQALALEAARSDAEQAADRLARLHAVTTALADALRPTEVADIVVTQGVAALGATAGSLALRSEDGLTVDVVAAVGYPPALLERWQHMALTTSMPLTDAVRTGEVIVLPSRQAVAERYPHLATVSSEGSDTAFAAVPLLLDDRCVGGMGLNFAGATTFGAADRAFLLALGRQCAQALERARLFEAERQSRAAAEAALAVRDEFLAVAGHELQTPVAALTGFVYVLDRRIARIGGVPEQLLPLVQSIGQQAERLSKLIRVLLDVRRIREGQFTIERQTLDLGALVQRFVTALQPVVEKHRLVVRGPATPALVLGDALRLEQLLDNLLHNAMKYSPAGGNVEVDVVPRAAEVGLRITDHGLGIPPAALEHLFERYYRAPNIDRRQIQGFGIGLYVVANIVQLHGGRVEVESTEGVGSVFSVWLPAAEPDAPQPG